MLGHQIGLWPSKVVDFSEKFKIRVQWVSFFLIYSTKISFLSQISSLLLCILCINFVPSYDEKVSSCEGKAIFGKSFYCQRAFFKCVSWFPSFSIVKCSAKRGSQFCFALYKSNSSSCFLNPFGKQRNSPTSGSTQFKSQW